MKRKIIIIISLILGIVLIRFGIKSFLGKNGNTNYSNEIMRMDFASKIDFTKDSKKIVICKNKNNCTHALNEENYNTVKYDYNSKRFQRSVVNKYNNYVLDLYNETIKSTAYPGNCKKGDMYNYYTVKLAEERFHENSRFISFTILPIEVDYCKMTNKSLKPKVFNYSKQNDKLLSTTDFIYMLGLNEKIINDVVTKYVDDYNADNNTNYAFDDLVDVSEGNRDVFFINNGELDLSFYNKITKQYDITTIYDYKELLKD